MHKTIIQNTLIPQLAQHLKASINTSNNRHGPTPLDINDE
jgi:hypothetical protein